MGRDISETVTFDATPAVVYRALVDAKQHAAFTGSHASNDGKVGGPFSAYDGYIVGFNVELVKGVRVIQAWRANEWKEGAWSIARFELAPAGTGRTKLTLTQAGVPDAFQKRITRGWKDFYWVPLASWLRASSAKARKPPRAKPKTRAKK
ncbi:MAG: SRPBCC domain-containing protein [Myxococcales bacterium]|nr:SRPBCC domain-containing protein [Myxococcales bacterium]